MTTMQLPQGGDVPAWELCDALNLSMRKAGLGSGEMASRMGVTPSTVSRWLNGRNEPSRPALMVWAALTGCDVNWLYSLCACRDSNPKPSDLYLGGSRRRLQLVHSIVKPRLTANPRTVEHHPSCPARHGSGECAGCGRHLVAVPA